MTHVLRIHYGPDRLARAKAGKHNFTNRVISAFEEAGFRVQLVSDGWLDRKKTQAAGAYSITRATAPLNDKCLVARRAYVGPFWWLDQSDKRWEFTIARTTFDPDVIDQREAERFARRWRKELFGQADPPGDGDGSLLIPLQARLLDHRSFQSGSPVDMLRAVASARPDTLITATLHPKVAYSEEEMNALHALIAEHPNLTLGDRPTHDYLPHCSAVVTQNSGVAFSGFFQHRPAVLFGKSDFHHIVGAATPDTISAALNEKKRPDYDRFLYWFLKLTAISAGSDQAEEQILAAARSAGWPV